MRIYRKPVLVVILSYPLTTNKNTAQVADVKAEETESENTGVNRGRTETNRILKSLLLLDINLLFFPFFLESNSNLRDEFRNSVFRSFGKLLF
jgi:hypothetical protein